VQDVAAGIVPVAERTASDQAESAPPPRQRVLEREEPPIPLTRPTPRQLELPRPLTAAESSREEVTELAPKEAPPMLRTASASAKGRREHPRSVAIRRPESAEPIEVAEAIEPRPSASTPPATAMHDPGPPIAPPPPEPHTRVTPVPEQPRLVIGRM